MAQSTINYYNRIQFLRTNGNQLLQRIQMLEIGMNRRKQQNQQPYENEITMLQSMVKELLQMLAEINTCEYFQKYPFNHNDYYYKQMCTRYFNDLMLKFIFELKARRRRRNLNYDIDFMINK